MAALRFHTLDVFTDRPFSGNPLAVFPQCGDLPDATMQRLARELNLSETVFVGPPTGPMRFPVRIFTPARELPFAGHPTVGTALLLDALGFLDGSPDASREVVLEQGVGPVPVSIQTDDGRRMARFRTARLPETSPSRLGRADAAVLIGLDPAQIVADPVVASCGVPFQMIELDGISALGAAALDPAQWRRQLAADPVRDVYCFTRPGARTDVRARMFAPSMDIAEDPATGAAAAALAGYLASLLRDDGTHALDIEQGIEMGRPSLIRTEVARRGGQIDAVFVSGQAVTLSDGTFHLP
jgi:trans-2,3-dihydro-3-hydroxyanthranilate isomerase